MTYVDGRERWAGRVYDGPLEGEHRTEERPYFYCAPYMPLRAFCPDAQSMIDTLQYRWSNPLRCWVFVWSSAPQARKKRESYTNDIYYTRTGRADWQG